MQAIKQHILLLVILTILIMVKFILVPVFSWQDNLISDIRLLDKKQSKVTAVLNSQQDNQTLHQTLNQAVTEADNIFFPNQTDSAFKLTQQKMLESLLEKHKLSSQNIGWEIITQLPSISAASFQLQLRFSGTSVNIVNFITSIESLDHYIEITDFNLSLKGQREGSLGRMDGRITLQLYMDVANANRLSLSQESNTP